MMYFAVINPKSMPDGDVHVQMALLEVDNLKQWDRYLKSSGIAKEFNGKTVDASISLLCDVEYCLAEPAAPVHKDGPMFYFDKMLFRDCVLCAVSDDGALMPFHKKADCHDAFMDILGLQREWGATYFPHVWESMDNAGTDAVSRKKS